MPLYEADGSIDPITLQTVPDRYVIFYSSVVDGEMWCPVSSFDLTRVESLALTATHFAHLQDCRAVEQLVKETFSEDSPVSCLIVYVGDRTQ